MSPLYKFFIVSFIYIFIHTEVFIDFVLINMKDAIDPVSKDVTTIGEILRYIIFIILYMIMEIFFDQE